MLWTYALTQDVRLLHLSLYEVASGCHFVLTKMILKSALQINVPITHTSTAQTIQITIFLQDIGHKSID